MRGPLPDMTVHSISSLSENFIIENISRDSAFSFTILVSNTIGVVSTKSKTFCECTLERSSAEIIIDNELFYTSLVACPIPTLFLAPVLDIIHADTTDVQIVTATLMEGVNASIIQCEFVAGSTATGCMVVLTGFEAYNIDLTRDISMNSAITTVTLERPPSCYTGVEAFDIESDGSVGTLSVPGQLGGRLETPCATTETLPGKLYHCLFVVH